ncbi:MAG TPA: hypothetical protein VIK86_02075 [Candidatus Paceibacterota bacterium]
MIELDKYEQQIILACKNWGKQESRYKAVRIVISQYYAIPEEELELYTIYGCLLDLFVKVKQNPNALQYFMENIFKDFTNGGYKREIDKEHIIRNLISSISESPVLDNKGNKLFKELEPDYEILNKGMEDIIK